jgi:hypothetical protein
MNNYTYNFEVRRMILHFMAAIDGAVIKRYDKDQNPVDSIAVNYIYGPKQRIMKDLIDSAEHVKLPIVAIMLKSISRDSTRGRDNIMGRAENILTYNDESNLDVPAPIPVNLVFELTIMAKYQMDLEQIITNFIPYSDPYFIVSWKEPFTNHEIRSEILWNGDINIDTPVELQGTDAYSQITATTAFTYKGYMFKNKAKSVGKICRIDSNFILTDKWFCDYDNLVDYAETLPKESFTITGKPIVSWADPIVIKSGSTMPPCTAFGIEDYDPYEIIGRTETLTIEGQFNNITDIFLSASDVSMFSTPVSTVNIFEESDIYPEFEGIMIDSFKPIEGLINKITFDLPVFNGGGRVDVIVVNECGYSKLSVDRHKINNMENPYNSSHPLYNPWIKMNDPFNGGIEVIDTDLNCVQDISILQAIDGKIIKTLGDYFIVEM